MMGEIPKMPAPTVGPITELDHVAVRIVSSDNNLNIP